MAANQNILDMFDPAPRAPAAREAAAATAAANSGAGAATPPAGAWDLSLFEAPVASTSSTASGGGGGGGGGGGMATGSGGSGADTAASAVEIESLMDLLGVDRGAPARRTGGGGSGGGGGGSGRASLLDDGIDNSQPSGDSAGAAGDGPGTQTGGELVPAAGSGGSGGSRLSDSRSRIDLISTTFDVDKFMADVRSLRAVSEQHAALLSRKAQLEATVQQAMDSQWRIENRTQELRGTCGCGNEVVYYHTSQVAAFYEVHNAMLKSSLQELGELFTGPVFSSLFDVTNSELRLMRYVHGFMAEIENDPSLLGPLLDRLFTALADSAARQAAVAAGGASGGGGDDDDETAAVRHTAGLLRALVVHVGSLLIEAEAAAAGLVTGDDGGANGASGSGGSIALPPGRQSTEILSCQSGLLARVLSGPGFAWAAPLLQPTAADLASGIWLRRVLAAHTVLEDDDLIAFTSQLPWETLGDMAAAVCDAVLAPIQAALPLVLPRSPASPVALHLYRICIMVAAFHPPLTPTILAIMQRTPWPSKALSAPFLASLPYSVLPAGSLNIVFAELFGIHEMTLPEFAALDAGRRAAHRAQWLGGLCQAVASVEAVYAANESVRAIHGGSRLPVFTALAAVAARATEVYADAVAASAAAAAAGGAGELPFNLASLVLGELFTLGFLGEGAGAVAYALSGGVTAAEVGAAARTALAKAVTVYPPLFGEVLQLCAMHLHVVAPVTDLVLRWIDGLDLRTWAVDDKSVHCLAFLLGSAAPPPLPLPGSPTPDAVDELAGWVSALLPQYHSVAPNAVTGAGVRIGAKVFDAVTWSVAPSLLRVKAFVALLAASPFASTDWLLRVLLADDAGAVLLAPPLHMAAASVLAEACAARAHVSISFAAAHFLLRLALAEHEVADRVASGSILSAAADYGVDALVASDFFTALGMMAEAAGAKDTTSYGGTAEPGACFDIVLAVWSRALHILRFEAAAAAPLLGRVLADVLAADSRKLTAVRGLAATTLCHEVDHGLWVRMWAAVLAPLAPDNESLAALFDEVIFSVFVEQGSMDGITLAVSSATYDRRTVDGFLAAGFVWLVYAATLAVRPQLPSFRSAVGSGGFTKADRESGFFRFKDVALSLGDHLNALPFWEQFFVLYFEAASSAPGFFGGAEREELNKSFVALAQAFEDSNKDVYRVYYGFTTWSDEVIPARGLIFSDPQMRLMSLFTAHTRPLFTLVPGSAAGATATTVPLELFSPPDYPTRMHTNVAGAHAALPPRLAPRRDTDLFDASYYESLAVILTTSIEALTSAAAAAAAESSDGRDGGGAAGGGAGGVAVLGVEALNDCLGAVANLSSSLRSADSRFLELSSALLYNFPERYEVRVACKAPPEVCPEPAGLSCQVARIAPRVANVTELIAINRSEFSEAVRGMREQAKRLAQSVNVLQDAVDWLLREAAATDNSDPVINRAGRLFFFSLFPVTLSAHFSVAAAPIWATFASLISALGDTFVRSSATDLDVQRGLLATITAAPPLASQADSADSGGATEAGAARAELFSLLNPQAVLSGGDLAGFIELLSSFASADCAGLNSSELSALAQAFDLSGVLATLGGQTDSDEVESLLDCAFGLFRHAETSALGVAIVEAAVAVQFPRYVVAATKAVLRGSWYGYIDPELVLALARLPLDSMPVAYTVGLLQAVGQCLPVPARYVNATIIVARRLVLESPAFAARLNEECAALARLPVASSPFGVGSGAASVGGAGSENDGGTDEGGDRVGETAVDTETGGAGGDGSGAVDVGDLDVAAELPPAAESSAWIEVARLFFGSVSPFVAPAVSNNSGTRIKFLAPQHLRLLLELVVDLVNVVPALVDRVWYVFVDIVAPFVKSAGGDAALYEMVGSFVALLPWPRASFHYRDPAVLVGMWALMPVAPEVVASLFRQLDWEAFLNGLDDAVRPVALVHFLRLLLDVNLVAPVAVPELLRALVGFRGGVGGGSAGGAGGGSDADGGGGAPAEAQDLDALALWDVLSPLELISVFDGTVLLRLLRSGAVAEHDPSDSLVANTVLLYDVVCRTGNAMASMAVARETHAVVNFSLAGRDPTSGAMVFWRLPAAGAVTLVSTVLVPLALEFGSHPAYASQLLVPLLGCAQASPPHPVVLPGGVLRFATESVSLTGSGPDAAAALADLRARMLGVVEHFCSSVSPATAVEVLNIIGSVIEEPSTIVALVENTARALFTAEDLEESPLPTAGASLQLPRSLNLADFVGVALEQKACLALLIALEQSKRRADSEESDEWVASAIDLINVVCVVEASSQRAFELFPLWFFVLDLVSDERWAPHPHVAKAVGAAQKRFVSALEVHTGTSGGTFTRAKKPAPGTPPYLQLGARAVALYLTLILSRKGGSAAGSASGQAALEKGLDALAALRGVEPFNTAQYEDFFDIAHRNLTSMVSIEEFKESTIRSLVPFAQYLAAL